MGPLAVRPEHAGQRRRARRSCARASRGCEREGATVIGLETMPRTMDNIGFYSALGFLPGPAHDHAHARRRARRTAPAQLLGRLSAARPRGRARRVPRARRSGSRRATTSRARSSSPTRSRSATRCCCASGGALVGFALCHTAPLVEGRTREELRVLKLALARRVDAATRCCARSCDFARRSGTRRVALRVQGEYPGAVPHGSSPLGARVRWTDLRMTLGGYEERAPRAGIVLSNWEI